MRITNSMMVSQFLTDANRSLNRVAKAQQQVQSTKRINSISDDPLATIATLQARNRLSALANYQSTLKTSRSYLKEAETSTGQINDLIQSVYELMASANNDTKELEDRQAIAQEIENLRNELFTIGNTSVGASYIFGGDTVTQPPFSMDDEHLIYNGIDMNNLGLEEDYYKYWDNVNTLSSELEEIYKTLGDSSTTDFYARNSLCEEAVDKLGSIITNLESAYNAAEEYSNYSGVLGGGTDATGNAAKLEEMRKGIDSLKTVVEDLSSEKSKDITPGDTTGMTPDELDNCFSRTEAQAIIGSLANALGFTSTTAAAAAASANAGIATFSYTSAGVEYDDIATFYQPNGLEADGATHGIKFEYSNFQDITNLYAGTAGLNFDVTLVDTDATDDVLTFTANYGGENYVANVSLADLQYDQVSTLSFHKEGGGTIDFELDITPQRILSDDLAAQDFSFVELQNLPLMSQKDFVGGATVDVDIYEVEYVQADGVPADDTAGLNGLKFAYYNINVADGTSDTDFAIDILEVAPDGSTITFAYDGGYDSVTGAYSNVSQVTIPTASLMYGTPGTELEFLDQNGDRLFSVEVIPERISGVAGSQDIDLTGLQSWSSDQLKQASSGSIYLNTPSSSSGGTSSGGITNGSTGVTATPSPTNPPAAMGSIGACLSDASVQYTESFIEVPKVNEDGSVSSTMRKVGELFDQLSGAVMDMQIGASSTMNSSANGFELLGKSAANYYYMFDKCTKILNGELDESLMSDMIGELQQAISDNSTLRTRFGTSLERADMIEARYTESELTYESMRSEAEDVDLAEAIMEWSTAKTVYDAALAAGAQTIQVTLLDFVQ